MFEASVPLCRALRERGCHITIETAGTIDRAIDADLMSISPKLSTSTPGAGDPRDASSAWRLRHESRRINLPALQGLIDRASDLQLKFVVCTPADLVEIDTLLAQLRGWKPADVLLMPEGVTPPTAETRAWIAAECLRRSWRYCPRLHIELFGNRRGT